MMYTTKLYKVGGSVMLEVPPSILEVLHLSEGAAVEVAVEHGGLVVKPLLRPKYTLDELLAKCDATAD